MNTHLKIAIIIGSVRQNRFSEKTAQWIYGKANEKGLTAELIDLRDYPLPFFEDPISPSMVKDGNYASEDVKKWAEKIKEFDAYIMITPEYNHSTSGVLKNALDSIYAEWNNKAVAFVSHGAAAGGSRAVEHLRQIAVELQMAPIRNGVHVVNFWTQLDEKGGLKTGPYNDSADKMIEQLIWWANALKTARKK